MIDRLRMRHVRCFLAVVRAGSVTAAAKEMNTSQPALSRSLAELEEIIGQPLFDRTGRGLIPTEAGENLRRHLDAAVGEIETGVAMAGGGGPRNSVAIGMLPNVARTLMVEAAASFKAEAPDIDLEIQWGGVEELRDRLQRGELDFLVSRLLRLNQMAGLSFEYLYGEALVFVVSRDHPLAGRAEAVTLHDLMDEIVVVPIKQSIIRDELDRFLRARGINRFPRQIETVSFDFTRSFVAERGAVACLPIGAVRDEIETGRLATLDLQGEELNGSVGISFLGKRKLSAEAELFADHVRKAALRWA